MLNLVGGDAVPTDRRSPRGVAILQRARLWGAILERRPLALPITPDAVAAGALVAALRALPDAWRPESRGREDPLVGADLDGPYRPRRAVGAERRGARP